MAKKRRCFSAEFKARVVRSAFREDKTLAEMALRVSRLDPAARPGLVQNLLAFFADRMKVALKDQGLRHDLITAVFAVAKPNGGAEDDLLRLRARVEALSGFLGSDDGANLLVAERRAANIVRIESKKDKARYEGTAAAEKLAEAEEKQLFEALAGARAAAEKALASEDFAAAMAAMAGLRQPVDAFFDRVTVNCEEPELRANRLRLLASIGATLSQVADFSKIEGA